MGGQTKRWQTQRAYNDGLWHTVTASRLGADGKLTLDNEDIDDTTPGIDGQSVESIETIAFGGYSGQHPFADVTKIKFDGCIDHVVIMSNQIDLRNNIKAYDVTPGCPVKVTPRQVCTCYDMLMFLL